MEGRVTASFATIPERLDNAWQVYNDLLRQVDEVRVHSNGISCAFSYSGPEDLGDAGKFANPPDSGYWIVCDDDLIYPPDFAQYLLQKIEEYDRQAVICLGGKRFDRLPVERFIHGYSANYRILDAVAEDEKVHVPLTCGVAFHTDTIRPSLGDFPLTHRNMADIHFGRLCQRNGVPIVCAKHEKEWIRHQEIQGTTIWIESKKDDRLQTQLVNQTTWT